MTDPIYDWRAARSGATITIRGRTRAGAEVKITDVAFIEPRKYSDGCTAVLKGGGRVMLLAGD